MLQLSGVFGLKGDVVNGLISEGEDLIFPLGSSAVIKSGSSYKFLRGHDYPISSVASNGLLLATGERPPLGFAGDVLIWDRRSGSIKHRLSLHKGAINALSFSRTGQFLASIGDDSTLAIWNTENGTRIASVSVTNDDLQAVSFFNQAETVLVTGGTSHVRFWTVNVDQHKLVETTGLLGSLKRVSNCLIVAEDDAYIYVGTTTGDILEIDTKRGVFKRSGPKKLFPQGVVCMKFLDRRNIILGTGAGVIAILDIPSLTVSRRAEVLGKITSITFVENENALVGTSESNIYSLHMDSLTCDLKHSCHSNPIQAVCFPFGLGEICMTCSLGEIRLWSLKSRSELLRICVPGILCNCLKFSQDGKYIFSGWDDGKIRVFLPQSGKLFAVIHDAHKDGVTALDLFSSSGPVYRIISGGAAGDVRVWSLHSGTSVLEASLNEHRGRVFAVKVKRDCSMCVSCSADGSCIVWDLKTYHRHLCIFEQTMFKSVCYHPDETQVVTAGSDRRISFWDAYDAECFRALEGAPTGEVNSVHLSHSGSHVASGGGDGLVKVWDYESGACIATGEGHSCDINSVAFSPDQKYIVSAGSDCAIFIWELPIDIQEKCIA
jgi:cilia- and flagella-associated protein 52